MKVYILTEVIIMAKSDGIKVQVKDFRKSPSKMVADAEGRPVHVASHDTVKFVALNIDVYRSMVARMEKEGININNIFKACAA